MVQREFMRVAVIFETDRHARVPLFRLRTIRTKESIPEWDVKTKVAVCLTGND